MGEGIALELIFDVWLKMIVSRIRAVFLFILMLLIGACAINRVDDIQSQSDALSLYKVPVVYGFGVAKNSMPFREGEASGIYFVEYDPIAKKSTQSCLGTADTIVVSGPSTVQSHELNYHVLMVPPGYYVSTGNIQPPRANPYLYFKIERGYPQYLGDYRITKSRKSVAPNYSDEKISVLPVEYDTDRAVKALQAFNISADQLRTVKMVPTEGVSGFIICSP